MPIRQAAPVFEIQGRREAGLLAERIPIVSGGTRQMGFRPGVGETEGNKVSSIVSGKSVDNCKGASGLERGT